MELGATVDVVVVSPSDLLLEVGPYNKYFLCIFLYTYQVSRIPCRICCYNILYRHIHLHAPIGALVYLIPEGLVMRSCYAYNLLRWEFIKETRKHSVDQ